ncbi:MAG: hypothetical protein IKV03_02610 [Alphaproteobacteria bacterium]|nr:hypothetical protein [Alphaproteobacteria bacterium]
MTSSNNWMIKAVLLDKTGGATPLNEKQIHKWKPEDGTIWIHINLSHPKAKLFLKNNTYLDEWTKHALINPSQLKPCSFIHNNGLLLIIRTTNLTPRSKPDDMVFLSVFATKDHIISTRIHPAISFKEIMETFDEQTGPKNTNELIEMILENTLNSIANSVSDMEEYLDDIEEKIISHQPSSTLTDELTELMRRLVIMHRFLTPQRDALETLPYHRMPWFNKKTEHLSRNNFYRMQRIIEDITLLKERCRINQEALNQHDVKQSQKNMYMLSVIATIFLPLSFLASLFGMNVGGIPFSEDPYGLALTACFIASIGILLIYLFKRAHWL